MTAPHPFWSRVPEWLLDWALRRLYLPLTLEATRRLVERHAGESAGVLHRCSADWERP